LNGTEPLSGYSILAVEGSLNGQTFACSGDNCSVPLNEGNNDFTFWAISSWGDSSQMGTFSAKVDTVPPTLGLGIASVNGVNGWYVSPTPLTATGSDSTSGLSSVFLSVDNGAWQPSIILNEGVYNILVQAEDNAGNIAQSSTVVSVDMTTPTIAVSVNGTTGNNGWYSSNMEVSATANDATSGVGSLESSLDGGVYQAYNSPVSFADGYHTVQFKAIDKAGNETETSVQEFYVDTITPAVDLPAEWEVNDTITYKVQDDGSGLSALRIVIEDEDEKFAKVAWNETVSGNKFKGEITWNGKFEDGTVAPPGEYLVWVKVTDVAGNERIGLSRVIVPSLFSLFSPSKSSTAIPTPPADLFDPDDSSLIPTSPNVSFGGSPTSSNSTSVQSLTLSSGTASASTTTSTNVLWGATAAALIGWATATAMEEKKKRKEQEQAQAARVQAEVDAFNAAQSAKRIAETQQWKINSWLEGQAILDDYIAELEKLDPENPKIDDIRKEVTEKGLDAAIASAGEEYQSVYIAKQLQEWERQRALEEFRRGEQEENNVQQEAITLGGVSTPILVTFPIEATPFWKFWATDWNLKDAWNGLVDFVTGSNAASTLPPQVVTQQPNSTLLIHPSEKIDLFTNPLISNLPAASKPRIILPAGTVIPAKKQGDGLHATLDAIGLYPGTGIGEAADFINALIYLSEGRKTEAGISFASVVIFGDFLKAGKWTVKVGNEALELTTEKTLKTTFQFTIERATRETMQNVALTTLEKTTQEALEQAAKKAAQQAVEKAAKEAAQAVLEKIAKETGGTLTKEVAKAVTERALKEFAETSAERIAKEAAENATKQLTEKLAQYPLGSPLRLTPAELLNNKEAQQTLYDMAKNMRDEQAAYAKKLLEELNISGEVTSILKRDSLEEFIEGVTKKMERNDYAFAGQMDDMSRGRFNLDSWEDVSKLTEFMKNQSNWVDDFGPRRLQPNGGYGYPRYHLIVQDAETFITHEWQIGTKATTELFESVTPGIKIPEGLPLKEKMHNDLHDIEYDIFKAIQDKKPDLAQKYGIPEFRSQLDLFAGETGKFGMQVPNLTAEISKFHSEASEILRGLFDEMGPSFFEQFYH